MANKLKRGEPATVLELSRAVAGKLSGDPGEEATVVTDVTHDSRQAALGTFFVAIRGGTVDANRFIDQVMERGAAGVISEDARPAGFSGPWMEVGDARRALAAAAALVHGHPSREIELVGITGTNGKTTTAYLVAAIVEAAGEPVAMTGTVEYRIGETRIKADRTTPEASDMQRLLRRAVEAGCRAAVMECSSQAMDFHRCDSLHYSVAVFTNLTRDHLDYHKTMEAYFHAKSRLFDGRLGGMPRISVINIDDPRGVQLAAELKGAGREVLTYALNRPADVSAAEIEQSFEGTSFRLKTPAGQRLIRSPLVGRPHVYNLLAAAGSAISIGYDLDVIANAFQVCTGAPGRFERVPSAGGFSVVVDYAHSDDALLNVLRTAREVASGRIITVFGCGGDRDRSKRAPMGEAAGSLSDVVILTSDNPRSEDPLRILADAEAGLRTAKKPYQKVPDRREAIHRAIAEAQPGDLVLIAGKGHEDYQVIGSEVVHFDDKEIAREALVSVGANALEEGIV
jgi:UDP-N-acetylmuramoyl-L-alanyl-D-glutamate--2,6-diaminopimelate ligase